MDLGNRVYKVVLLGGSNVGKYSLIARFVFNKYYFQSSVVTGLQCAPITLSLPPHTNSMRVELWDCPDSDRARAIALNGVDGIMLVYDVGDRPSFEVAIRLYLAAEESLKEKNIVTSLIGNKADVGKLTTLRDVGTIYAASWAKRHDMRFFETSAFTGAGVATAFMAVFEDIWEVAHREAMAIDATTPSEIPIPMTVLADARGAAGDQQYMETTQPPLNTVSPPLDTIIVNTIHRETPFGIQQTPPRVPQSPSEGAVTRSRTRQASGGFFDSTPLPPKNKRQRLPSSAAKEEAAASNNEVSPVNPEDAQRQRDYRARRTAVFKKMVVELRESKDGERKLNKRIAEVEEENRALEDGLMKLQLRVIELQEQTIYWKKRALQPAAQTKDKY